MKPILDPLHAEVLATAARGRALLAFDFDGTLAPIVDEPESARMREQTRALLCEVARRYPTIVISGRAQGDVLKKVRGVSLQEVIGNHGLEPWRGAHHFSDQVQQWVAPLARALGGVQGVELENKVFSLAVHYRKSRQHERAAEAIAAAAGALERARLVSGKRVVNLIPEGAPHKGIALGDARARLGCELAIYVGDDDTDEDVFGSAEPSRLLSIRVERSDASGAEWFIESQGEIDALLAKLLEQRAERSGRHRPAESRGAI